MAGEKRVVVVVLVEGEDGEGEDDDKNNNGSVELYNKKRRGKIKTINI